jgi:hypothetical protein
VLPDIHSTDPAPPPRRSLLRQFGSAITYLFELAPPEHKGVIASLGQLSIAPGIALGILMVQVVVYACTPGG